MKALPERPPYPAYPELKNTIPPATAGPGPIIDAPRAGTALTVGFVVGVVLPQYGPVFCRKARSTPSLAPENTAPGITVIAADCAPSQPRAFSPHFGLTRWREPCAFSADKVTA
jgi:hypothetical protein